MDKRFTRLKWLTHLLDGEKLDGELRWKEPKEERLTGGAEERL